MIHRLTKNVEVLTCERPLAKGEPVPGHRHKFPHPTICHSGALRLELLSDVDGSVESFVDLRSGDLLPIHDVPAGREHRLIALEDNTRYMCLHLYHDKDGAVVSEATGWESPETVGVRLCRPDME
jgi:quercetin dioxygenase-like cupin family protein